MSERPAVRELERLYVREGRPLPRALEQALAADPRAGARAVLDAVRARRRRERAEGRRLSGLLAYERAHWGEGRARVAGVDEAGMSPLAGPVVAAAVILPVEHRIRAVDDSKALDAPTRERLAAEIKVAAVAFGVGVVEPGEIDAINIHHAGLLAMRRALLALDPAPEAVLVDGRHRVPDLVAPQQAIVRGDTLSLAIAAASIIAKTTRDARMVALDAVYPGYGFAQHKGYGVPAHKEALRRLGPCPAHRRSFGPVRAVIGAG